MGQISSMKLTDHSLRQLDEKYIKTLGSGAVQDLCVKLLADLKEARERLRQNPDNSSRPPSSRAPWEKSNGDGGSQTEAPEELGEHEDAADGEHEDAADEIVGSSGPSAQQETPELTKGDKAPTSKRKAGKQHGQPGHGRTQKLVALDVRAHHPDRCAGCGDPFGGDDPGTAYTAFQTVDLRWGDPDLPGIHLHVIEHRYFECVCRCGHETRAVVPTGEVGDPLFAGVALSEWRLVGPGLAALIVCLALRFRLSHAKIREFLWVWMGLSLSVGTISKTIHEAGAAVAPAEAELIQAVRDSGLVYADETPWKEQGSAAPLWLWVFSAAQVTLYLVGRRGSQLLKDTLGIFTGWLMSDGWGPYRHFPHRLRCWAHLLRKARGIAESYDAEAMLFGDRVLRTLETLMDAVYAAREHPPDLSDLTTEHAEALVGLKAACGIMLESRHEKSRALAYELLNDWDAIFQVLAHPHLPLTNNEAERCLRHWVILRKISHGTRSSRGTKVFSLLASVTDTCRKRGHAPWRYLEKAIAERRAGLPLSPLPVTAGV